MTELLSPSSKLWGGEKEKIIFVSSAQISYGKKLA